MACMLLCCQPAALRRCQHDSDWVCLQTVKAPGNLVVSTYVCCPDITATVTPDLKLPGSGQLLHVPLAKGRARLGGSALAQAYGQVSSKLEVLLIS